MCFWIAALYALLYVWYMAGGFDCATIKGKWGTLDVNQCCLSTQCDVVRAPQPESAPLPRTLKCSCAPCLPEAVL